MVRIHSGVPLRSFISIPFLLGSSEAPPSRTFPPCGSSRLGSSIVEKVDAIRLIGVAVRRRFSLILVLRAPPETRRVLATPPRYRLLRYLIHFNSPICDKIARTGTTGDKGPKGVRGECMVATATKQAAFRTAFDKISSFHTKVQKSSIRLRGTGSDARFNASGVLIAAGSAGVRLL